MPAGGFIFIAMAKLVFEENGASREWELGSFLIGIGRHPDNNIVVKDKSIALNHAQVGFDRGQHYVQHLSIQGSTHLNGAPISREFLKDGDKIDVGPLTLRFLDPPVRRLISSTSPPAARAAEPQDARPVELLDELMQSIRSHRDREQIEREREAARILAEWERLLTLAEQLKARTASDPRMRHFGIDRKANDVMIRVVRGPQSSQQSLLLALRHPDYPDQDPTGLWLIRTGQPSLCLATAQAVGTELIRDLAFLLA